MPDFALTEREADLVHAALSQDPSTAVRAWRSWSEAVSLHEAPTCELRLLPVVYANLSRIAPDVTLPQKLRGNARATFTFNHLIGHESLPVLRELTKTVAVMVTKGAAFCTQFNAWSFRQTGDVDIHVRRDHLARAVDILTELGWVPKYGMTPDCLRHRTPLRRNSWSFTKEKGDIDLHWQLVDGADPEEVERRVWSTAETADFLGVPVLMPSPECSTVSALHHGFSEGTRSDSLQTLVDCRHWLPRCHRKRLREWISLTGTAELVELLGTAFKDARLPVDEPASQLPTVEPSAKPVGTIKSGIRPDLSVVRHRRLYRLWEWLGRRATMERLILRFCGPFSKPPRRPTKGRLEYDLRDCTVIDEIGGPGWGWPEPEHTCFWSDQADNRLLVDLPAVQDYLVILSLSDAAKGSPNPQIAVYLNGRLARHLDLRTENHMKFTLLVPGSVLFGRWLELSFRPTGFDKRPFSTYAERRSLPAVSLQIIPAERAAAVFAVASLRGKVDRGEEPYQSKFKRVELKMRESVFKNDPRLPADFDPVSYVLLYDDLLEAEVDPYHHFIGYGSQEGRVWF
jgi:hypothetical protein